MVSLADVRAARETIRDAVRQTPMLTASRMGAAAGINLWLKAELFQRTGAFKVRGVLNRIRTADPEELARGIITISSGNHAQATAWAAREAGVSATIVMAAHASQTKIEATRGYGAEVILIEGNISRAFEALGEIQRDRGLMLLQPFDDPDIIAGHGTIGLEIMEQVPDVDVIVCAVGGGGLLSGVSLAAKSINPDVRVYGVEPVGAAGMRHAWDAGEVVHLDEVHTFADGLAPPMVGKLNLEVTKQYADDIITLTEDEIATGLRDLMMYSKLYAEGAGAAATGALIRGRIPVQPGENVVSVVSGGNLDTGLMLQVLSDLKN